MTTLGKLTLCFACFAAGVVTAESYRQRNESALPSAAELRFVYFDPTKGRAVECLATDVDATRDGGLKLWYGSGMPPQEVKVSGVVIIRPHNIPVEQ